MIKLCELLAMSFNKKVKPSLTFRGFRHRGNNNPDGWGFAFYPDSSAQVYKEPLQADRSELSDFIKNYCIINSKLFISHVRFSTSGGNSYSNTHPFNRKFKGKDYVFAHNGTLCDDLNNLKNISFISVGETDSELAFCFIMNAVKENNISNWGEREFSWFQNTLKEINNCGKFNCIFSDGEYLFCYHDKNDYKSLRYLKREAPFGKVKLTDEDFTINLTETKDHGQKGYIVATEALTDEDWKKFTPGEMKVFKEGKLIYSSQKNISELLSEEALKVLKVIRSHPHRISSRKIVDKIELKISTVIKIINRLMKNNFIRQDRRDNVGSESPKATFYTNQSKRKEIDQLLNY